MSSPVSNRSALPTPERVLPAEGAALRVVTPGVLSAWHQPTADWLIGSDLSLQGEVTLRFRVGLPSRRSPTVWSTRPHSQRSRWGRGRDELAATPSPLPAFEALEAEHPRLADELRALKLRRPLLAALVYVWRYGYVTAGLHRQVARVGKSAAARHFQELTRRGLLARRGGGRGQYYEPGECWPAAPTAL